MRVADDTVRTIVNSGGAMQNSEVTLNRHERRRAVAIERAGGVLPMEERFVREPECRQITALSRTTRWRLERAGKFPRRRKISPGTIGWLRSEIAAWLADRAAT